MYHIAIVPDTFPFHSRVGLGCRSRRESSTEQLLKLVDVPRLQLLEVVPAPNVNEMFLTA